MNLRNIIIGLSVIMLCSCVAGRSLAKSDIDELLFGFGGGFTGNVTTYSLKKDGSIYKGDVFLKKISKKELSDIFAKSKILADYQYNNPSNMYLFLVIKSKSNKENKIVWGMENKDVDNKVTVLYDDLKKLIK